jgi:hypothetical protein
MNNPFDNPSFSMSALTAAINILPNNYGLMESMGLFPAKPVRFRSVVVEEKNGILTLLPTMPVGSPGTVGKRGKRKLRSFAIPHIPHDDVVLPEEVQGIRAFGSETEVQTVAAVMAEHLQTMRNKHSITLEHLRIGALKGIILDADGSELYNLFDLFDITPKVVNFQLTNAATDVKKKCLDLKRYLEKNLKGERMSGVHCLVSEEFFDALTSHENVKAAYDRWQDGLALRSDLRSGFTFAGITFEEYSGEAATATTTCIASSLPARATPSRWARWTPSPPTSRPPTSTRRRTRWASRCTRSRSRASSSAAPTSTLNPTRCRCAIARRCW